MSKMKYINWTCAIFPGFYERRIICIMYSLVGLCIVWVYRWGLSLFLFVGGVVCPVAASVDGRDMLSSWRGVVFFGRALTGGRGVPLCENVDTPFASL